MNKITTLLGLIALVCALPTAPQAAEKIAATPRIQMAILLDTSNSMDGLIGQAKTQLWKIVNEFVSVERDGQRPDLEIALYEYGNDRLESGEGYIRMVLALTTDLDKVSEELFALTTNGGDEYCGKVIQAAAEGLKWSKSADDYKVIFIAGNEAFTQGDVPYSSACKAAIEKGIIVNTIHCGSYDEGVSGKWKDGALLADGSYMNIDQDSKAVHIASPQDAEITRLGTELNTTYIPYGAAGKLGFENQKAQDTNAKASAPGTNTQRSVAKGSANYRNTKWDLVDALKEDTVKLDDVKTEDLPEEMQKMTLEERKAYIDTKSKERAAIQEKISKLNTSRKKFVAEELKKLSETGEDTLDAAMIRAIREQAESKKFELE